MSIWCDRTQRYDTFYYLRLCVEVNGRPLYVQAIISPDEAHFMKRDFSERIWYTALDMERTMMEGLYKEMFEC